MHDNLTFAPIEEHNNFFFFLTGVLTIWDTPAPNTRFPPQISH